ncbi:MAG: STELLO glycosyltransferase family protein [Deltaproteobacteria bacterium]|nr:STELLO glycosyltransferase family protein [Deltaproteobacteria bacterium]
MKLPSLIITSIAGPRNGILVQYAKACAKRGVPFFLIGDVPSPQDFTLEGCRFYGIEDQQKLDFRCLKNLPLRHYARKNIGYLLAIREGAQIIIETDDDNVPEEGFWNERSEVNEGAFIKGAGWVNAYSYFTDEQIWPRGYPLDLIKNTDFPSHIPHVKEIKCPVQQGLANDNPDVDAIYRLVAPLPLRFRDEGNLILGEGSWCPFNSQNTTWFPHAFPLLYLPSFCSFRMTDIWRSFVAQRICWANGWGLLFHGPTVSQIRNDHDLMKDFNDEIAGYLHNRAICDSLAALPLKSGISGIPANMMKCYEQLTVLGHIDAKELTLLEAWLRDLDEVTPKK